LSPSDLLGWKAGQEFGWTLDKSWYDALEAQKETNPLAGWMEAVISGDEMGTQKAYQQLESKETSRQWMINLVDSLLH
ncbi:MAG: hypothetical protein KDC57_05640, partial [Saprospiraceae bacterium]|nr:hypothetical protein [Saprospiraceae bacterium]